VREVVKESAVLCWWKGEARLEGSEESRKMGRNLPPRHTALESNSAKGNRLMGLVNCTRLPAKMQTQPELNECH
jgi:hypothetical protein